MYVKFVCVKLLYVKFIVVYVRRREEEAGGGEGARDTESKTRTPHKDVGNKGVFRFTYEKSWFLGVSPY